MKARPYKSRSLDQCFFTSPDSGTAIAAMAMTPANSPQEKPKEPAFPKIERATELLESILLNLPLQDILVIQRVSKRWNTVITGSSAIQKALFLQPVEDIQLSLVETRGRETLSCTSQWNCEPWASSLEELDQSPESITRWGVELSDTREYRIVINPILGVERPWNQLYFYEDYMNKDRFLDKEYQSKEASWRNMLFAQPPLQEIMVRHTEIGHYHLIKATQPSKGLTLGDVHHSKQKFKAPIEMVWGEDGFSRGVPKHSPAYDILEKLGVEPAPENIDEAEPDTEDEHWQRMEAEFAEWRDYLAESE